MFIHITTESHVDVCGLGCHLNPSWCEWSVLPSRAMLGSMAPLHLDVLMSVGQATAKGHVITGGLCCHLRPC